MNDKGTTRIEQQTAEPAIADKVKSLLDYRLGDDRKESRFLSGAIHQRETHSKDGSHVFLVYNDHDTSRELPPQFFIQVYGPTHTKAKPDVEEYKWSEEEDPFVVYPGRAARIEELVSLFEAQEGANDG